MDRGLAFLIFVFALTIFSTIFYVSIRRWRKSGELGWTKISFFFLCGYCFLLSVVKCYLGDGEDTLVESFWDSERMTYVHYGLPLIFAGIVVSISLVTILRKYAEILVKLFDAYMFIGMLLSCFLEGRISNTIYCVVFCLCAIVACITTFVCKPNFTYIALNEYRKTFFDLLIYTGPAFFMVGIFLPNELYLSNISEFRLPYIEFFVVLFIGVAVICVVFILLCIQLLPQFLCKYVKLSMAGITIMGYIQNMFFNGKLKSMDGSGQTWSGQELIVNAIVWIVIIGIIIFGGYYKTGIERLIKIVCIYIVLIQIVTLGYLIISTEYNNADKAALTIEGALELGTDNNIIVFVLDRFDSAWMETLVEEDGDFVMPLSDFIYYRNATSQFAHTGTAIPYMLTGVKWNDEKQQNISYMDYAYENGQLLSSLKDKKYDVGIYTNIGYISDSVYEVADNYRETVEISCDVMKTLELMLKSSMYKVTPFILKSGYSYYSGDMSQMAKTDTIWNIDNDLPFYHSLINDELTVTSEFKNAFRFYHMRGAHFPFYLSEDLQYNKSGREVSLYPQIKGCLRMVYEYLEQLRALGKYDDSTIIITADHGQQVEFIEENNRPEQVSMPVILVKEANRKEDSLQISEAPVSQEELIPTIMKAIGNDWKEYGKTFDEISDSERERTYIDVYMDYHIIYTIRGDAKDLNSWSGVAIE